jgi:exodeoxyribonuclease V alpha subunit
MLDLPLALALFRAIPPGCSVVLVGDKDQLPSVGPGTVLASFLASGWFRVTQLERIFRQAEGSRIVVNAHRVNRGLMPEKPRTSGDELADFYWIEQDDPEKTLAIIEKMVVERIPARFPFDPVDDVQILTPMNRGCCGTVAINERLEALLNPSEAEGFRFGERSFKAGDKIMQTANNYDKNVFNGDMGRIARVNHSAKKFTVLFDGPHTIEYGFDEADQLMLAYAVTVHKAQGSEYPAVILPFLSQHYMMLQRNLLYTAMTRAKKLLILVGSERAVRMAVENARLEPRSTLLTERLREKLRELRPERAEF